MFSKWLDMLLGRGSLYVDQGKGRFILKGGYYNDLRGKVKSTVNIDEKGIPFNIAGLGEERKIIYFPISVFQYGLGAFDLYLETGSDIYKSKLLLCVDWALEHQDKEGAWDAFGELGYENKYSAMAQGEAVSLLLRAYKLTGDKKYFLAADKAVTFLLRKDDNAGIYDGKYLYEYGNSALVLNGFVFAFFGVFDYVNAVRENALVESNVYFAENELVKRYYDIYLGLKNNLASVVCRFNAGFWSYYDTDKKICSPFYQRLHIAQMDALFDITGDERFWAYRNIFEKHNNCFLYEMYAVFIKVIQKLKESKKNKEDKKWIIVS